MLMIKDANKGADSWRIDRGANVFPADSKNKVTYEKWEPCQTSPIPLEQHETWKRERAFDKGLMVMPGIPWHRPDKIDLYLTCIDWDKQLGFDELFTKDGETMSLDEVAKEHFIEQHLDDKSRGHLWLYSPIAFPKKSADTVLGLEVKSLGSHGVIISSPSIHKDGYPYEMVGISEPVILSKDEAFAWLFHIDRICKKHNVTYLDKSGNGHTGSPLLRDELKDMIKTLSKDYSIKIQDGQRHDTMIAVANSILFRHSKTKSHDKLKKYFMWINNNLCKPSGLLQKEISKIWEDTVEYVSRVQKHHRGQEKARADEQAKTLSKGETPIAAEVHDELKKHVWATIRHSPTPTFMVAHSRLNQILEARQFSEDKNILKVHSLQLRDVYINAIPIEITRYEDPINVSIDQRYKIKFRTSAGKILTTPEPMTIDTIMAFLNDNALICSTLGAKGALSVITNAFASDGSLIVSREIETPGFYLIDGRIKAFQIEIKDHTQKELAEAAQFLNALVTKHHRKEIPATTIKWSTVGPFDYALKQYTDDLCWVPWLGLAGWPRSGKGTQGRIACGIWESFYHSIKNYIPFTTVNTEARLGKKLGQCTLPLTINECDALNDDKNRNMLEMMKNCMETRVSRGKYATRTLYVDEPALSPCILTSNPPFPSELGFRSRIVYIVYTKDDKHWDALGAKEFTAFILKGRKHLNVYGYFVAKYILDNQRVLLKENIEECDWKQTAELVLQEFYKAAGLPLPEWVSLFVDEIEVTEAAIQEANETNYFEVRGFFEKAIIDGYRLDPKYDEKNLRLEVDFQNKLGQCLDSRLISFLHKHDNRAGLSEVVITHDIIKELKKARISNVTTMQGLAKEIPGFECGPLKLNGLPKRVVHGSYDDFTKFLDCNFEEDA